MNIAVETRRDEAFRLHRELFLSRAMEMASTPIFMIDRASKITWANNSYAKQVGISIKDLNGTVPSSLLEISKNKEAHRKLWDTILGGDTWVGEVRETNAKKGTLYVDAIITPLQDARGNPAYFLFLQHDVTNRRAEADKMWHVAHHDNLTGLANRALFLNLLEHTIHQRLRDDGMSAVLFIDLDKFKPVNDTYGHPIGDELLKHTANVLKENTREEDIVARFGGDEFGVILTRISSIENAEDIANKIVSQLCTPVTLQGCHISFGASIGLSIYPYHATSIDSIIKAADEAMYSAKAAGRNCCVTYSGSRKD